jgi:D-aspartate ligase
LKRIYGIREKIFMNVLLLDGDTVEAISVLKSLKKIQTRITIFCEHRISFGYASRYPDSRIIAPAIKDNESNFLQFLLRFLKGNPQDLIIPLYNDGAEFLSRYKDRIKMLGTKCAIPDYSIFIKAHDKEKLMEICEMNGIPHPRTANPAKSSIELASEYVGFPLLIKPNISSGARGISFVRTKDKLEILYKHVIEKYGACTFQEYVNHSGVYYNVMLYRTRAGQFANSVVTKILRYFPIKGGTSSFCISINQPELLKQCMKLLDALDWHGFADIDIIKDEVSQDYKIIEINPRIPASINAAAISGINFPEIILKDTVNLEIPKYSYESDMELRYLAMDVLWFIFSSNRFSCSPSWFKFFGRKLYYQDGSLSDPLPMVAGILMGTKKYLNSSFRKSKFEIER